MYMATRQWSTWGLLLIWALAFWGARGLLWIKEYQLEQSLKVRLAQDGATATMVSFSLLRSDSARLLHWEHSREFAYGGQMYDVLERRVEGDSLFLRCYWDEAESALKRQARRLQQQSGTPISQAQQVGLFLWVRPCLLPESLAICSVHPWVYTSSFPVRVLPPDQVILTPPHAPPNIHAIL